MDPHADWCSLRQLDEEAGLPKGSAFRAFKRCVAELQEGSDFLVLDHNTHAGLAGRLHAENRLYRSSVHPVLLAPHAAARVREILAAAPR